MIASIRASSPPLRHSAAGASPWPTALRCSALRHRKPMKRVTLLFFGRLLADLEKIASGIEHGRLRR